MTLPGGTPVMASTERAIASLAPGQQGGYTVQVPAITCRQVLGVLLQSQSGMRGYQSIQDTFDVSPAQVRVVFADPPTGDTGVNEIRATDILILPAGKYEIIGVEDYTPFYVAIYVRIPSL